MQFEVNDDDAGLEEPCHGVPDRLHQSPAIALSELERVASDELARGSDLILVCPVNSGCLLTRRFEHHVSSIDDGLVQMCFPRADVTCVAQVLTDLGRVRERFDSDEQLAAAAGVAPFTSCSEGWKGD